MADSGITKKALASSLKACMAEKPFHKISINDICVRCSMNRKSFYYHFRDKYDLLHWLFDNEYASLETLPKADAFSALLQYLAKNRSFYRKAFEIEGQNSLEEHFRSMLYGALSESLRSANHTECSAFHLDFLTDGCLCAIKRWLFSSHPVSPDELEALLRQSLDIIGMEDRQP